MRYAVILAIVACATLRAAPVDAQSRSWELWLGAGPAIPLGDLSDDARTGLALQGSLVTTIPSLPVKLRADLYYHDSEAVEREPGIDVSLGGEWYRQVGGALYAQLSVPVGSVDSYGLLGAGYVREWHGDRTFRQERQTSFNVNAGAGIAFPLFGVGGFFEGRLMNLLGSDALRTGPPAVHREVEFKSIALTLGFRL